MGRRVAALGILFGLASCQLELRELSGRTQDQFGSRIFCIQDLDGDGIEEYVVGDDSYGFMHPSGPGHLWILSGMTLECLATIEAPESRGPVGALLGTYAQDPRKPSADRIVTLRWESEGPVLRVLDAREGGVIAAVPLERRVDSYAFVDADVNADGINDLVLGLPGDPSTGVLGGCVRIFDGERFEPLTTLVPDDPDLRYGESVAALVGSGPGANDTLLVSETQYSVTFPPRSRARIIHCDPSSEQRTLFLASGEEDNGVFYRILPVRADDSFVVVEERDVGSARDFRSVAAITRTGDATWNLESAVDSHPQWRGSIAVLDDVDRDGYPEVLTALLSLQDAGPGQLYLSSGKEPGRIVLGNSLTGLGASIATARNVRTGRIASIAVGACNPDVPVYQGQVVLLTPDARKMLRFARRTGPHHTGVRVGELPQGDWFGCGNE